MNDIIRQQAEHIFKQAVERPQDERAAFLATACGSDLGLRSEVESLLEAFDGSEDLVTRFAEQAGLSLGTRERALPDQVGAYRLLEPIGEGGMGIVFRAEQERPQRTVALKLIRQGFDSGRLKRRFELEAEMLGRLQHAGIAQIYEAGTSGSPDNEQPFFAMELVDGIPIHRYAAEKQLDVRERLALIIRVCEAVQHAHQKGIIHRDLKPDNILVTADGQPKILDFGVARAADRDFEVTAATLDGQLLGTIPYMSPEQVGGRAEEIDTRSDVYALGVVLYQLLTGKLPHDLQGKSIPQAISVIANEEPLPIVGNHLRVPADVVTITNKSLAKDRELRYVSAAALADDLRRWLHNEPIEARPATALYQFSKFARRNRGLVLSMLAVVVVLIGGVTGTTLGWFEASRQRDLARTAQETAEAQALRAATIADFLRDMLSAAQPGEGHGYDVTVLEMLEEAAIDLDRFEQQPEVEAALQLTIAESYIGLGQADRAEPHLAAAIALYDALNGPDHIDTLTARYWQIPLRKLQGRIDDAVTLARGVLVDQRRALGPSHIDTLSTQHELAGILLRNAGLDEAEELLEDAYAKCLETLGPNSLNTINVGLTLASILHERGRDEEAERIFREASEHLDGAPPRMQLSIRKALADSLHGVGRHREAEPLAREVVEARRELYGPQHPATLRALNGLGQVLTELRRFDEAEQVLAESLAGRREVHGEQHPATWRGWHNLGTLEIERGNPEKAIGMLEPVLEARREMVGRGQPPTLATITTLARAYGDTGRREEAIALLEEGQHDAERELGNAHIDTLNVQVRLAYQYKRARRFDEAEALYRKVLDARMEISGAHHEDTIQVAHNLGRLYQDTRRPELAEKYLLQALEARRALHEPTDARIGNSAHALAVLYRALKRDRDAMPLHREKYEVERAQRPDHVERWNAYSNVGFCHFRLDEFEQAAEIFAQTGPELSVRMGNHWWVAAQYVLLGRARYEMALFDAAEPALLRALEIAEASRGSAAQSQRRRAIEYLGKVYRALDQPDLAEKYESMLEEEEGA